MGKRLASMSKALTGSVVDVVIDNQGGNVLLNRHKCDKDIFYDIYHIYILVTDISFV
jgi:hypothetical protein